MEMEILRGMTEKAAENISRVIIGKSEQITLALTALLADGHLLLEDVPGTGKTMLAKAIAKSFDCEFGRIQFTPDLLPSELTGINFYSPKTGEFNFRRGSLFANIILADEINRATPRTQSGLLESMEERQITVDGDTYPLDPPYFVIATQNPVETHGTFPLPEAQLDRFLMRISLGYPARSESIGILKALGASSVLETIEPVCAKIDILEMQKTVRNVYVHDDICAYIVDLCQKSREHEAVQIGASTRGLIALTRAAQAYACIGGRAYVVPEDIKHLFPYVFSHRLALRGRAARVAGATGASGIKTVLSDILEAVAAPTEDWKLKSR